MISAIKSAVMDLLYVSIVKEPIESICKGEVELVKSLDRPSVCNNQAG